MFHGLVRVKVLMKRMCLEVMKNGLSRFGVCRFCIYYGLIGHCFPRWKAMLCLLYRIL